MISAIRIYASLMVTLLVCVANTALASNVTVFPPVGCSQSAPYFSWDGTQGFTSCQNGQHVLQNALPVCGDGQIVTKDGGLFICREATTLLPPKCEANEFLTFDGESYLCKMATASIALPECRSGQVLTVSRGRLVCINQDDGGTPPTSSDPVPTYNRYNVGSAMEYNRLMTAGMEHFGMTDWAPKCLIADDRDTKLYSIDRDCTHFACWSKQGGSIPMPPYSVDASCVKGQPTPCGAETFLFSFTCWKE